MDTDITYRGLVATTDRIEYIKDFIHQHPDLSRRAISLHLCETWNWLQPNGSPRDMVCRGFLLTLHRAGCITLPPPRITCSGRFAIRARQWRVSVDTSVIHGRVKDIHPLRVEQVRRTDQEPLFDGLIANHHYLGYSQPVGEHLKYLVYYGQRPIGCFAFSSAPRHIGCRDRFIGWDQKLRRGNIHLLAYNTRFLIVPWVKIRHLASHLLACIARRISADWQAMYAHPLYFLETFVDTERFAGTCYKAANWIYLGLTTGRGKNDQTFKQNRSIKAVWGYPLHDDFREKLCHVHE